MKSSILNFHELNLREANERHEGLKKLQMMVSLELDRAKGLAIIKSHSRCEDRHLRLVVDYSMPNVRESRTDHP